MRRQISLLLVAVVAGIVISLIVPLALLVDSAAKERALAGATEESRNVAAVIRSNLGREQLASVVAQVDQTSPAATQVRLPRGAMVGSALASTPSVDQLQRAASGVAFTAETASQTTLFTPVLTGRGVYVVITQLSDADLDEGVLRAWIYLGLLGLALIAAAGLAGDRMARRLSAPLVDVADVARDLARGDLERRAVPSGPPEVSAVGGALNDLGGRIGELLVLEREAMAALSHRLRTPVTALRLEGELLSDPEQRQRVLERITAVQVTIDELIRQSREPLTHRGGPGVDLRATVLQRLNYWQPLAEDQGRDVVVEVSDQARWVALESEQAHDLVDVLLDNVFAHSPEGTAFWVRMDHPAPGQVRLEVGNALGAVPSSLRSPLRVGTTGVGLDIVRRQLATVGGQLDTSIAGGESGGTFRAVVSLPLVSPEPPRAVV